MVDERENGWRRRIAGWKRKLKHCRHRELG
jgi:hypothetical protein